MNLRCLAALLSTLNGVASAAASVTDMRRLCPKTCARDPFAAGARVKR